MTTPKERAQFVQHNGGTLSLQSADNCAQISSGRIAKQKVDMVALPAKLDNNAVKASGNVRKCRAKKAEVRKNFPSELRAKYEVDGKVIDAVTCCIKIQVPDALSLVLETIEPFARICVDRMLAHRDLTSSRFFHEIPCVVAKSLITKYQRNKKCKAVKNLVLPLCGDKGKQIKLEANGIRVPALFRKSILPIVWLRKPVGFIRRWSFSNAAENGTPQFATTH
jgi:hypothetical protein